MRPIERDWPTSPLARRCGRRCSGPEGLPCLRIMVVFLLQWTPNHPPPQVNLVVGSPRAPAKRGDAVAPVPFQVPGVPPGGAYNLQCSGASPPVREERQKNNSMKERFCRRK